MNNLAEVCLVGLGVGGNYVKCPDMSIGLGGAMRCGGDFKVIILREARKGASHKEGSSFCEES